MQLWLNIGLAWVCLILAFILSVIYILRLLHKKTKIEWIKKLNRTLRKHHKFIGLALIATGLVHGLLSSDAILSFNLGTLNFVLSIILSLNWMFRKKLDMKATWIIYHRIITVAFVATLVFHIVSVGGFLADDLLRGNLAPPTQIVKAAEYEPEPSEYIIEQKEEILTEEVIPSPTPDFNQPTEEASTPEPNPEMCPPDEACLYKDGIYRAEAVGYHPGLIVEVEIINGEITRVEIIDHNEKNEMYWGVPVELLPQQIIEKQSTDVDTISGATMTSCGIIDAVNMCLEQALN